MPVGFLQWNATNQSFVLRVNAVALQNAPVFEGGQFPDMSTDDWDSDIDQFWQNPDAGGSGAGGGAEATATP